MHALALSLLFASSLLPPAPTSTAAIPPPRGVVRVRSQAPEEGIALWLERLGSGSATERQRAERWLATHLELSDYPILAESAREADAETTRRLALALGADGRHLGLVVLLEGEPEGPLQEIGRAAFGDLVTRWCRGAGERPALKIDVKAKLFENSFRRYSLTGGQVRLDLLIERMSRLTDLGVPLVLAPASADEELRVPAQPGTALDLLATIAHDENLAYTGVGDWDAAELGSAAWVLVSPQGGARSQTGTQRMRTWCRNVERGGSRAVASARALAATEWPAALGWLEERWLSRRDRSALEGLLLAAADGRVTNTLLLREERARLIDAADEALATADPAGARFAERVARALIGAGTMTFGGADPCAELLEGWERRTPAQQWLRLMLLEGLHSGRSDVHDFLVEIVEDPAPLQAALRLQALRALAASPRRLLRSLRPAGLSALLERIPQGEEREQLAFLLTSLGVEEDTAGISSRASSAGFLTGWRLRRGDAEGAGRLLAEFAAGHDAIDDLSPELALAWHRRLARWRGELGPRLVEAAVEWGIETLEAGGQAQIGKVRNLEHLALLGGVLANERHKKIYAGIAAHVAFRPLDYHLLGALAAGAAGDSARSTLITGLGYPPLDPPSREALAQGLDRAVATLHAALRDEDADDLREVVWALARDGEAPMHIRLSALMWPTREPAFVTDLVGLDRELPRELH